MTPTAEALAPTVPTPEIVVPTLDFVKPSPMAQPNVMLYGGPKVGKSAGAASAPGPILYINADTANATRYIHAKYGDKIQEIHFKGLETFEVVKAVLKAQPDRFGTVVLDTAGDAFLRIMAELSGNATRPPIQYYQDAYAYVERFWRHVMNAPVCTVLICHETTEKDEGAGIVERLPYTGTSKVAFGLKLMGIVDIVGYCGVVEQEGEIAYMAGLRPVNGRRGGDRFDVLGKTEPVDITDWAQRITAAGGTSEPEQTDAPATSKAKQGDK